MKIRLSHPSNLVNISTRDMQLPEKVTVYDCTLRDGEQTPGVALNIDEKLHIAKQLEKIGVDVIEAGFPVNSADEKEAVKTIAGEIKGSEVSALARIIRRDIDTCLDCSVDIVHVFVSTSDVHLKYQIEKTREEVLNSAVKAVEHVKDQGLKCIFSPMDATRTDFSYLIKVLKAVEEAGVDTVNIPDTVGVMVPSAMKKFISRIRGEVKTKISVHCHNDYGLAVANTLAAVEAGASEVQVTVNGLGERAGNAALEPTVAALATVYGVKVNLEPTYLTETSRLVERYTKITPSPCTPIIGRNAFTHESGIHVDGIISKPSTYEPIIPEDVGQRRRLVIGKHTGTHSVKKALEEMGIKEVPLDALKEITRKVKEASTRNKLVTDVDLIVIADETLKTSIYKSRVKVKELVIVTGLNMTPSATVKLQVNGEEKIGQGTGVGPVDAAAKAIEKIIDPLTRIKLKEFSLRALTGGTDALAHVAIIVEDEKGSTYTSEAVNGDIVVASVKAIINGINKALYMKDQLRIKKE